jgi:hypothetical protein
MGEISYDDAIALLEKIRDDAAALLVKMKRTHSALPGSYCVHCGETVNGVNGTEECPVSRYMARVRPVKAGALPDVTKGEVHGQPHLWSAGHVEDWFNYSGPRGAEKGFPDGA